MVPKEGIQFSLYRMRNFLRTPNSIALLAMLATVQATAQCPIGSINNTAGSYNNGQRACVTTNFSGNITLRNGATLTVINGGNYTGALAANNGSTIAVQTGGRLAPSSANNFAGDLTNDGTVIMNTVSVESGASFVNNGNFLWQNDWSQHAAVPVANNACGTMTFASNATVASGADIDNNGRLNFQGQLTMSSGASINNRGGLYVNGNVTSSGLLYNQYMAVFRGGNNNLGAGDSLVNLAFMVFSGSVNSSRDVRNEGLLQVNSNLTVNSGTLLINNTNAQVRVNGTFTNDWMVEGSGNLYVGGSINNNFFMLGLNLFQRLRVNKPVPGLTFLLSTLLGMTAYDTTTYVAMQANPDVCGQLLPTRLSGLQGLYEDGGTTIRWTDHSGFAQMYYVEYSTDGQHFVTAGEVAAGTEGNYHFEHVIGAGGTLYYRIRQQGANGQVQYSNVLIIRTGAAITTQVFPNPFTDNLQVNITLPKSSVIQVALYNSGGQLMKQERQMGQAGRNAITLNGLSSLLPGIYFTRITTGSNTIYSKLVK